MLGRVLEQAPPVTDLRTLARDHLWLHFTRMHGYEPPVIVRGEGCYLWDDDGKRYLDALAGLFSVNIGYSYGEEVGQAALAQMRELPFYTNWSYAHPRAIELAAELARLAPEHINRAFFVSGGSEAVESAWKLARQYHAARGERRWKAVSRRTAYHGTTMGALSINGIPALRAPFEPLVPDVVHVRNTNRYHRPPGETEEEFTAMLLDDLEEAIVQAGPETVAMVIFEPVQNAGGSFTPPAGYFQGVRAICDRYGILLCADEVITGFGRLGDWFGSSKYDIRPDLITCAKGLSSSYAAIGAVLVADSVSTRSPARPRCTRTASRSAAIPSRARVALKNLEIMQREQIVEGVAEHEEPLPRAAGDAARSRHRRRPARRGLPVGARAREGQGDARDVLGRGVRDAAARIPLAAALRARADLPRRRPRRPGGPDLAAARRGPAGVRRDRGNSRRGAHRRMEEDQLMATTVVTAIDTTAFAQEEKSKLVKSLRRFDMVFFTVCAFVGLDTLGTVASNGPEGFFWLVALALLFVAPYMLVMAEVGSAFTMEGGPYEWVKLAFGPPARRHRRGPLLGHEPALGRRLARLHRDRLLARERLRHRSRHVRRLPLQAHLHLDLDRRRDHLAALGQVDPEHRRVHAHLRARLLLDHGDHLRHRARLRRLRAPPTSRRRGPCSSGSCRCCSSTTSASSCRTAPPRRWRIRSSDVPLSVLRSGILGVLLYVIPIGGIILVLPTEAVTGIGGFIDAVTKTFSVYGGAAHTLLILMTLCFVGTLVTSGAVWMIGSDRIQAVAAYDGAFFPWFGVFNRRFGTPVRVNVMSGIVSTVFCFSAIAFFDSGENATFQIVLDIAISTTLISYIWIFLAALRLRYTHPEVRAPVPRSRSGRRASGSARS